MKFIINKQDIFSYLAIDLSDIQFIVFKMSSQNSQIVSKCCDAITKGHNCRNFTIRGEKWCEQHKKKHSNTLVVHTSPVVNFEPIVFSQYNPSDHQCKYQNKFGEFVCKSNKSESSNHCQEHTETRMKFVNIISKLCDIVRIYKIQHKTFDSYMKLIKNIVNYCDINKECFVNFNLKKSTIMFKLMIENIINNLLSSPFESSLVIHKKSTEISLHLISVYSYLETVKNFDIEKQIKKARVEAVSNNIKINKLTEICLKKTETSTEIFPVFCKGIDKKILSFIV